MAFIFPHVQICQLMRIFNLTFYSGVISAYMNPLSRSSSPFVFHLLLGLACQCTGFSLSAQSWTHEFPTVGTFSSPHVADLNGDGTADILLGAGRDEFKACDSAMMALDGRTGKLLWKVSARDQIFGSATLRDVTGDGIADVFIGGRSAELKAIDGAKGKVLWEFLPGKSTDAPREAGWYNFYNPQFIPDQNGDGIADLLVSNGGDVLVEPYDPKRPAGSLMVISASDGKLISQAKMPDGKEIYMSIAVTEVRGEHLIIFGTGGETVGGNLFVGKLSDVLKGDLSPAIKLANSPNKGFIAPPAWVDITGDQLPDVVALSVDGRMLAFDGSDLSPRWTATMPNTEAYSSLSIGQFTTDTVPDFFVSVAAGTWPQLEWNRQFMVNGATGTIEYADSLGFYQTSTAAVADMNGDGRDEVLLSINYQVVDELYRKFFQNMLVVIDFNNPEPIPIGDPFKGNNISSSPWIGDLDGNGKLDILYAHGTNERHTYVFDGMQVHRLSTDIPIFSRIRWGAYMGSNYDGVFEK